MTLRGLIEAVESLVADAEADKADAIAEAEGTGERPDLWEWNVMIGLDDAKNMLAILRALEGEPDLPHRRRRCCGCIVLRGRVGCLRQVEGVSRERRI